MLCKNCGNPLEDGAMFCGECGTKVELLSQEVVSNEEQQTPQSVPEASFDGANSSDSDGNTSEKSNKKFPNVNKKAIAICAAVVVVFVVVVVGINLSKSNGAKNDDPYFEESDYLEETKSSLLNQTANTYMPLCKGWAYDDVYDYFSSIDCDVSYNYAYDSTIPENCVISQSLEAGTEIIPGSNIVFVISRGDDSCPEEYRQKIVVSGSEDSSYAYMELFIWEQGEWRSQYGCNATVGRNGIGYNYGEGKGITPAGEFKLGVLLSEYKTSNDSWPHKLVTENTCVVDDVNSEYYNTIVNISSLPDYVTYDPIGDTIINDNTDKCIYIEHNGDGLSSDNVISGKGSAITICGKTSDLYATAGCIDISSRDFNAMLNLLDYNLMPHIIIEVE